MTIMAEKRVLEMSEDNLEISKSVFVVEPDETVEALLIRVGMTGNSKWHYDQCEVRLKLVVPAVPPASKEPATVYPEKGEQ